MSSFRMRGRPSAWIVVAASLASVAGIARAGDDAQAPPRPAPFDLRYFPDDAPGLLAARPAAFFRAEGMGPHRLALNLLIAQQWAGLAKRLGVDLAAVPKPLRVDMIDQVATILEVGRNADKEHPRRLMMGSIIAVRAVDPIDWPALLRAWKVELVPARSGDLAYFRMPGSPLDPDACAAFPDDRTLILADSSRIKEALRRAPGAVPNLVQGERADRFRRGLVLAALDNADGSLARTLTKEEFYGAQFPADANPADLWVPSLFRQADRWTLAFEDRGGLALVAEATSRDEAGAIRTAEAAEGSLQAARAGLKDFPATGLRDDYAPALKVVGDLVRALAVRRDGRAVVVEAPRFAAIAEVASLLVRNLFGAWD